MSRVNFRSPYDAWDAPDDIREFEEDDPNFIFPNHMEWILKREKPYSYRPFYVWGGEDKKSTAVYHDRFAMWDHAKMERIAKQVWGTEKDHPDSKYEWTLYKWKDPAGVEKFIQLWDEDPSVKLTAIVEYCNMASGYPVYAFFYKGDKIEAARKKAKRQQKSRSTAKKRTRTAKKG